MRAKILLPFAALLALTGCVPDTEISAENTETILAATSIAHHINDTVKLGITSQASLANSLSRMSARTSNNFYIEDKCLNTGDYQFTGDYADSEAGVAGNFNLAFNQCDSAEGEVVGVVFGAFTSLLNAKALEVDYEVAGDFDISLGRELVSVTDFSADVDLVADYIDEVETNHAIYYRHAGIYQYDTSSYKGTITAKTIIDVEWRYIAQQLMAVQGEVTYTDEANNVLKIVHNTNGISTYVNNALVKTYSHAQWLQKF